MEAGKRTEGGKKVKEGGTFKDTEIKNSGTGSAFGGAFTVKTSSSSSEDQQRQAEAFGFWLLQQRT